MTEYRLTVNLIGVCQVKTDCLDMIECAVLPSSVKIYPSCICFYCHVSKYKFSGVRVCLGN